MGLCRMGRGITEMAHSIRQLDHVDVDSGRSAVGLRDGYDVQSFLRFAAIEVHLGQFLFLFDVVLAINFWVSRKPRGSDRDFDRAVRTRVLDCVLSTWRVQVKISMRDSREKGQGR